MSEGPTAMSGAAGGTTDRVRAHSSAVDNARIDADIQECLERHASASEPAIGRHIDALDREWDIERYLQTNAALLSLTGVVLGATVSRRFLVIPAVVFGFLLQHATQGWCPPLPVFRKLGVRTQREINRERYALKALRGDFDDVAADLPDSAKEPS